MSPSNKNLKHRTDSQVKNVGTKPTRYCSGKKLSSQAKSCSKYVCPKVLLSFDKFQGNLSIAQSIHIGLNFGPSMNTTRLTESFSLLRPIFI